MLLSKGEVRSRVRELNAEAAIIATLDKAWVLSRMMRWRSFSISASSHFRPSEGGPGLASRLFCSSPLVPGFPFRKARGWNINNGLVTKGPQGRCNRYGHSGRIKSVPFPATRRRWPRCVYRRAPFRFGRWVLSPVMSAEASAAGGGRRPTVRAAFRSVGTIRTLAL